jgi:hypothetical protein
MVVMCGFWATNTASGKVGGRSFSNRREPKGTGDWNFGYSLMDSTTGLGLAFAEQFLRHKQRAIRYHDYGLE